MQTIGISTEPQTTPAAAGGTAPEWALALDEPDDELPAGGYVGSITTIYPNQGKQRIEVTFDIAEGEHAGAFSACPVSQDWRHRVTIPYDKGHGYILKASVAAIAEANPGVDVMGLWRSDLDGLVGLTIGLILSYREATDSYGGTTMWPTWRTAKIAALRAGNYKIPGTVHEDGTREPPQSGRAIPAPMPATGDAGHEPDDIWGTRG